MDIYLGRFLSNGNCGYVLKPNYLRPNPIAMPISTHSALSGRLSNTPYSSNIPQMLHIKVKTNTNYLFCQVNRCFRKR